MCGIVAAFDKKNDVTEDVLLQFEDQSSRGTNGFGSIFIDDKGKFSILRATGQIKAIVDVKLKATKALIFHHRMPSSSKNKISQTHPIKIAAGDLKHEYYFVHNGVIRNDTERKKYHNDELGYKYSTDVEEAGWYDKPEMMFNDSEVLGYDIARFIEGQTTKVKTVGSAAFIMIQVNKKGQTIKKVFYGRNSGNPLNLAKTRDYIFISSEGKGDNIKENMLYSFKLDDYKINKKKMVIPLDTPDDKKDEKEDDKPNGVRKNIGFDDRTTDYPRAGSYSSYENDDWMTFEEEETIDKWFNAAQLELDNLRDAIKEATEGEQLYSLEAEDVIKSIARNMTLALSYARDLKASEYCQEAAAEDDEEILEGETVELPEKTQSK